MSEEKKEYKNFAIYGGKHNEKIFEISVSGRKSIVDKAWKDIEKQIFQYHKRMIGTIVPTALDVIREEERKNETSRN